MAECINCRRSCANTSHTATCAWESANETTMEQFMTNTVLKKVDAKQSSCFQTRSQYPTYAPFIYRTLIHNRTRQSLLIYVACLVWVTTFRRLCLHLWSCIQRQSSKLRFRDDVHRHDVERRRGMHRTISIPYKVGFLQLLMTQNPIRRVCP